MNQSLIHIEDQALPIISLQGFREVDHFVLDFFERHHSQVVFDKMQGFKCVIEMLSVQINFLCISIFINLSIVLGNFSHKIIQICASLFQFFWFLVIYLTEFRSKFLLLLSFCVLQVLELLTGLAMAADTMSTLTTSALFDLTVVVVLRLFKG